MRVLLQKLTVLCNNTDFSLTHDFNTGYTLTLETNLELYGQVEELEYIINSMIPCNIVVDSKNSIPCNVKGAVLFGCGICFVNQFIITNDFREVFGIDGNAVFSGGIASLQRNVSLGKQELSITSIGKGTAGNNILRFQHLR